MSEPVTEHVDDLVAELALGLVSGPERSDALGHLLVCTRCRGLVEELVPSVDALLLVAAEAEPPVGFESRVLERVGGGGAAGWRSRRWPVVALAAAVIAVVSLTAIALGAGGGASDLASATMRTADGRVVGQAYVYGGDVSWVFVAVPGWTPGPGEPPREYFLRLDLTGDRHQVVGEVDLSAGDGGWGTAVDVDPDHIRGVALVDRDGDVWCSAPVTA